MNLTYPVDALVSYHYYKRDEMMAPITAGGYLRLIGDSGAFSAFTQGSPIVLDEYARWCLRWRNKLAWAAALDVIGDAEATYRNWRVMLDTYGLETVPTLHAGGDVKWLSVYADQGVDFVGLGGLVGVAPRAFRWLVHVFRWARDHHPGMRFHAWGMTNTKILAALPVFSADSSGVLGQVFRFGTARIFDPVTGRHVEVPLDGRSPLRYRRLLTDTYGVNPVEILRSHPGNRVLLARLMCAAMQQYAAWLKRRHHVPPPAWATRNTIDTGPHLHLIGSHSPTKDDLLILGPLCMS